MKKLLASFMMLMICALLDQPAFSQINSLSDTKPVAMHDTKNAPYAPMGTFTIIYKDSLHATPFSAKFLQKIEHYRNSTRIIFLPAGDWAVVKVLPKNIVAGGKFIPLEEYIYADKEQINFDELKIIAEQCCE